VFSAADPAPGQRPEEGEPSLKPVFVSVDGIHELDLRSPLAVRLRAMLSQRGQLYAPHLANLGRPARGAVQQERSPEAAGRDTQSAAETGGG
jgi:hypothetical protein